MAASYGGLSAYKSLLPTLPADFPLPILLAQHRHKNADCIARILSNYTALSIVEPQDGDPLRSGTLYVLPPGGQATVDGEGRLRLAPAPRCLSIPFSRRRPKRSARA